MIACAKLNETYLIEQIFSSGFNFLWKFSFAVKIKSLKLFLTVIANALPKFLGPQ